jgi:hypothetical protein
MVSTDVTDRELIEHRKSFFVFQHLVLFAAAHIALTLACVALAFIGEAKLIALLIWVAGTLVLIGALVAHRAPPGRR